ncbi:MAG: 50S ribosomal protein L22 [Patescibacteria group bacterium]
MEVKAKARYLRMSPQKTRLVIDKIRGLDVNIALSQLVFTNKAAAGPVRKLLKSALANAEHNFKLEKSNLYIAKITADQGPSLKRWRPRAFGRATPIKKRTTHLSIILAEKVPSKKHEVKEKGKQDKADKKLEIVNQKPKGEAVYEKTESEIHDDSREVKPEVSDERRVGKRAEPQSLEKRAVKKAAGNRIKNLFSRKSGM